MGNSSFRSEYLALMANTDLHEYQKKYIATRYISIMEELQIKHRLITATYFILSNVITIAGVFVTAFISFDKFASAGENTVAALLWVAWALGIILTLANKFLYVFDIPKRYVLGTATLEKLRSEGYSFVSCSGKYQLSSADRYLSFCVRVEQIYLKSIGSLPSMATDSSSQEILSSGPEQIIVDQSK